MAATIVGFGKQAEEARKPGTLAAKARAKKPKQGSYRNPSAPKKKGKLPRRVLSEMRPAQLKAQGYDPKTLTYTGK